MFTVTEYAALKEFKYPSIVFSDYIINIMPNKGKLDISLNIMLKYKIFLKKLCSTKPAQMVPPHRTKWQPPLKIEQNLHGYYY